MKLAAGTTGSQGSPVAGSITGPLVYAFNHAFIKSALLMLTGAVKLAPELPVDGVFPYVHLERSFMHLGFHIYDLGFQSQNSEAAKPMVFTTTLLLIALITLLNVFAIWLRGRLRRKFGVEVTLAQPLIPYRETIRASVKAQGRHKKQTGGHGQFGVATVRFEPLPPGSGFQFDSEVTGGVIPKNLVPAVGAGVEEAMARGGSDGFPMVDLRAVCTGGKHHSVDSSEMSFKMAGSLALRDAIAQVGIEVLEPVSEINVRVPTSLQGDVLGDLNSRRAQVLGTVTDEVGVATGLVWTEVGGDVIFIEATKMKGKGGLTLTGQLGDVMKESAQAAVSWIRANAPSLGIDSAFAEEYDLHIHVPAAAIPKDGPSAGITMAVALASVLTGRKVRRHIAMTGEITLRGRVLPIGGLKEKLLAAHRAGIRTVLIPEENVRDLELVPEHVRTDMEIVSVSRMDEVLERAFGT